ncbi:MAG: hypothetical protein KKB91_08885 [Proteobacteria bacterium]|jgi:hypothetical protein|nr:hypothetical protein [Desulfocapsa sp.]MBU3945237.1 hypothetical protein [Pseudomonadota bacterium]MCG2742438.1 hypothetical protein [Desulfobacteraceae bacterium]MBU4084382.1 hypothetical protein [Pseudomonadota bacterium]MBU4109341.1 hypothetical protein [Pseudomonadota bacterium]
MAEIKSTMDMVMERAARMAARSVGEPDSQESERAGMRLAAEYISHTLDDLGQALAGQAATEQMAVRKGMAQALMRNILLPRNETLMATSLRSMQGLLEMERSAGDMVAICAELKQILEQYTQHKEQIRKQLEDAVRAQLDQKLGEQGSPAGSRMSIDPAMHPMFQKEWVRMKADLDQQYNQALDQRKDMLLERFS